MPVKAVTRAALVDTICDRHLDQRVRKNAAVELIRSFPAVTKSVKATLALMPRPISPATFDAVCDAHHEVKEKHR